MTMIIMLGEEIINIGPWDYAPQQVPVINNPFPGPMDPPEDWDFQASFEVQFDNPLPEGAVEVDREIFMDSNGKYWLTSQADVVAIAEQLVKDKAELAELLIDIQLSMATPEQLARAVELRTAIKAG